MKQKILITLTTMWLTMSPYYCQADDIDNIEALAQQNFRLLSEDLGALLSYKGVSPAEPLGVIGFDLGFEVTATDLENPDAFNTASNDSNSFSTVYMPKIHLLKGLPLGFDIGASYSSVPDSNISYLGFEVRYAILDGEGLKPALGIRYARSELSGVDDLDFSTSSIEVVGSKKLTVLTPYIGFGSVSIDSNPQGDAAAAGLTREDFSKSKTFAGINLNLVVLNLGFEYDKTGDTQSTTLKLGWRF